MKGCLYDMPRIPVVESNKRFLKKVFIGSSGK